MLRIPTCLARPGMVLAVPLTHPRSPGTVLLQPGVELESSAISKLSELGIHELYIRYPRLEFLAQYVNPAVHAACDQLTTSLSGLFERIAAHADSQLEYHVYRENVSLVLEKLAESPAAAMFVRTAAETSQPALRHATNTCFLSLLMGMKLEFLLVRERARLGAPSARDVSALGVGSLLHDIGMLQLDKAVLDRWNATHDEYDAAWREHVRIGHRMVQGNIEPAAATVVLHHHQKYDGSGFPGRTALSGQLPPPAGAEIHVFARIAAVAETFDRLRWRSEAPGAPEVLSPRLPTVRVLRLLRAEPYRRWLDPIIVKALINIAPPYPPGTMVTLNNGVRGVVVKWSPLDPCRVCVASVPELETRWRRSRPPKVYDLREHPALFVAEAEGFDVSQDNFAPRHPSEFDLAALARSYENAAADSRIARLGGTPA